MGVSFTVEMTVMIMFHGNMYSTRTHTHTLVYTRITNIKWHTLLKLQNKKTSISCYVQPPWRMLSRFTSTSTAQCWWQQPLPHSCFLSAGCEGGRKKNTRTYPCFSFLFISTLQHPSTHRCWGSGISVLLRLRAWMCIQVPCLISCFQPLGGDAQLTNSSQLPPFCGHMIWAITK